MHNIRTARVVHEVATITDLLGEVRLFLGVDAFVELDAGLSVLDRGAHTIRLNLGWVKRGRFDDPAEDIPPNEIRLPLADAALLHQKLAEALGRAGVLNNRATTNRTGDNATNVIRLATNTPEDTPENTLEDPEDPEEKEGEQQ